MILSQENPVCILNPLLFICCFFILVSSTFPHLDKQTYIYQLRIMHSGLTPQGGSGYLMHLVHLVHVGFMYGFRHERPKDHPQGSDVAFPPYRIVPCHQSAGPSLV